MKIAILHSGDLQKISPGGISQYIEKIIKYNKDNKIVLFGVADSTENLILGKEYIREINKQSFIFVPIINNNKSPLSFYYFLAMFKYFKILKNFDIVYSQRMEYALPFVFSKIRKKLVMAIHGSGMYSYLYWGKFIGTIYNLVEMIAIKNSKKVIVLLKREEYGLPYYQKKFKDKSNKFIYGKVPIDTEVFKKMDRQNSRKEIGLDLNDKVLIYFGRIDNNPKRVLLLPDIVKKVKEKDINIKCIVIGDGEDKDKLVNLINNQNLSKCFILKNKLSHGDELTKYISSSDISIILSDFEGICMSALESLACEVPVISTDVGDIKEYINSNNNGYILKSTNNKHLINETVKQIEHYFKEKDIRLTNKYEEYKADIVIKELVDLFKEIVRSNKGRNY